MGRKFSQQFIQLTIEGRVGIAPRLTENLSPSLECFHVPSNQGKMEVGIAKSWQRFAHLNRIALILYIDAVLTRGEHCLHPLAPSP